MGRSFISRARMVWFLSVCFAARGLGGDSSDCPFLAVFCVLSSVFCLLFLQNQHSHHPVPCPMRASPRLGRQGLSHAIAIILCRLIFWSEIKSPPSKISTKRQKGRKHQAERVAKTRQELHTAKARLGASVIHTRE